MRPVYSSLLVNLIDVESELNLHSEFQTKLQIKLILQLTYSAVKINVPYFFIWRSVHVARV